MERKRYTFPGYVLIAWLSNRISGDAPGDRFDQMMEFEYVVND